MKKRNQHIMKLVDGNDTRADYQNRHAGNVNLPVSVWLHLL